MLSSTRVDILKDMIDLFGGIRFRYMDIRYANGMQLLLNACAETLETLHFDPTDLHGEQLSPKRMQFLGNNFMVGSSFRDFGFSRNNSLRTLEIPAQSIIGPKHGFCAPNSDTLSSLSTALSTITSPTFSEVIIIYRGGDFSGVASHPPDIYKEMTPADRAREASWHRGQFEVFRQMYEVRDFQLMLCADVWDRIGEYAVGVLKRAIAAEKVAKRLDYLPSEPLVVYSPRGSRDLGGRE